MAALTITLPTPIERPVVLFDGHCTFCTQQAGNLRKFARSDALEMRDFQADGALDAFPGVTYDQCMQAMQLIKPDGRVYSGFEAAVHAVATRRIIGWVAYLYYVPGLKQLFDALYRVIARNRYELIKKQVDEHGCDGGTCSLHFGPPAEEAE